MTWTAAIMSDDNLDSDSLVGRLLRPSVDDVTWDSPTEVRLIGGRITDATGEPIMEINFDLEPLATVEPLLLWRVMQDAGDDAWIESGHEEGQAQAAQIEALRDWLLPEEPEPELEGMRYANWERWDERQRLRALLTNEARIARGER